MKTNPLASPAGVRILLWFAGLLLASGVTVRAATREAILEAIHQVENPNDLRRPGPRGELGAYQFRLMTWRMYTAEPFARALDREMSDAVAEKHYEWLRAGLERAGRPVTPYMIGLAWNGGLEAAIRGTSPRVARDYAERVANLTAIIERERVPISAISAEKHVARRPVFEFRFLTADDPVTLAPPRAE